MKYIKFWPVILAALLFFVGRCTAPKPDKELRAKYEQERDAIMEVIGQKDAKIIQMAAESREIRKQMTSDSLKFSVELGANKRAYTALKKKYNEINYTRYTAHDLDSVLSVLFPD